MIRAVGAIVPVHDEAQLLPGCLRALDAAVAAAGVRCACAVVLDACTDGSRAAALAWAGPDRIVVEVTARNVGRARAAGIDRVLEHLALPPHEIWLATTDADSEVPRAWLAAQLAFAADGADAVAGTIDVELPTALGDAFAQFYATRGDAEDHGHVHGANLGVRADAYLAAGGFAPLSTGEDHALWNALASRRRRKTRAVPVRTSARLAGRAPDGFAGFLRDFAARQPR